MELFPDNTTTMEARHALRDSVCSTCLWNLTHESGRVWKWHAVCNRQLRRSGRRPGVANLGHGHKRITGPRHGSCSYVILRDEGKENIQE